MIIHLGHGGSRCPGNTSVGAVDNPDNDFDEAEKNEGWEDEDEFVLQDIPEPAHPHLATGGLGPDIDMAHDTDECTSVTPLLPSISLNNIIF